MCSDHVSGDGVEKSLKQKHVTSAFGDPVFVSL